MARIAIVGSGVVGQATGKGFISKGYVVTFIDVKEDVINQLRRQGYGALSPSELNLVDQDVVFVSVCTPTVNGKVVLDHLADACKTIGKALKPAIEKRPEKYRVVAIRSTAIPGTLDNVVIPALEKNSGKKAGQDFGVAVNPEYLREKQAERDFSNPWIVVIGTGDDATWKILERLYRPFGCPIHRLSIKEAEFQKYAHNLFNATKISFFNEMRLVAGAIGLDPSELFALVAQSAEGMWHPAYGIRNMGPFGGSCLPKDTAAFLTFAKERGIQAPLLAAVIEVNEMLKRDKGGKIG